MGQLNPTLWRTCRMLAGKTRLKLLRHLCETPGQSVTQLAQAVNVGISDASQELRRIQSRGVLLADRRGPFVFYRLQADPQVPSAAPLLKALKTALAASRAETDADLLRIATGLSHPRRVAIARELAAAPKRIMDLTSALRIPQSAASLHARRLVQAGFVRADGGWLFFKPGPHPLAQALARLL